MNEMLLIDSTVLPEIYGKVVETKRLLSSGLAKTASQAMKMTGISRSAFYKYKDYVFVYNHDAFAKVATFQGILSDRPGVLSSFITQLYKYGANILTVNQDIPTGGRASVTVTVACDHVRENLDLVEKIRQIDGVISLNQVVG